MTQSQIWSNYFAVHEADQLRRFPSSVPLTPFEQAQYELALNHLRSRFPLDKFRADKERFGEPTIFWGDASTRKAFFDHFNDDRVIDIFCWRREEWMFFSHSRLPNSDFPPYIVHYHEFSSAVELGAETMQRWHRFTASKEQPLSSVFVRSWSSEGGTGGSHTLWHWNGEKLVHLPEYDSSWLS